MADDPIKAMFREVVQEEIAKFKAELEELLSGIPREKEKLIGAEEISEFLGISKRRAYELMELKNFPLVRIGSSKRVHPKAFENWLAEQREVNVS